MHNSSSYHGGQDYHNKNLPKVNVDLSVTTNGIGPNVQNLEFLKQSETLLNVDHYPPTDDQELLNALMLFMEMPHMANNSDFPLPIFGNGASELIDLCIRCIQNGFTWRKHGDVKAQYKEYEVSCERHGKTCSPVGEMADITVVVNPNNPTGKFMTWAEMVNFVRDHVPDGGTLVVDESMLPWYGKDWKIHSFAGHFEYLKSLWATRNVTVVLIFSWTKIFACTGLRIGTAFIFGNSGLESRIRHSQTPWPLNVIARQYVINCWNAGPESEYMKNTWSMTRNWRKLICLKIKEIAPSWKLKGEEFLSWIWIDVGSPRMAEIVYTVSRENGFPIRWAKMGYGMESHIRIGVRDPSRLSKWFRILTTALTPPQQEPDVLNMQNEWIHLPSDMATLLTKYPIKIVKLEDIRCHEETIHKSAKLLQNYITCTPQCCISTIIVTPELILLDGHHRLEAFKGLGMKDVPVTVVCYDSPHILTHIDESKRVPKAHIIEIAKQKKYLPPKSTMHVIQTDEAVFPLSSLSRNASIMLKTTR